jgi:hypothetical protein
MYVAVVVMIVGQALLLGQPALLLYGLLVWAVTVAFVRWYEEPTLARISGEVPRVRCLPRRGARLDSPAAPVDARVR